MSIYMVEHETYTDFSRKLHIARKELACVLSKHSLLYTYSRKSITCPKMVPIASFLQFLAQTLYITALSPPPVSPCRLFIQTFTIGIAQDRLSGIDAEMTLLVHRAFGHLGKTTQKISFGLRVWKGNNESTKKEVNGCSDK